MTEFHPSPTNENTKHHEGGALGNIDDLQGHPGSGQAPGPSIKPRIIEPDEPRIDMLAARKASMPERAPGAPWWGHADKTSPWWAK